MKIILVLEACENPACGKTVEKDESGKVPGVNLTMAVILPPKRKQTVLVYACSTACAAPAIAAATEKLKV